MAIKYRDPCRHIALSVFFVFLFTSNAFPYDGPVGVTFRAPYIAKSVGGNVVVLEGISVRAQVRIDNGWSMKVEGKGRAFPDRFIATIAESEITFSLRNQGGKSVKTSILVPFDCSNTIGTGFTEPFSVTALLNGRPVSYSRGPELSRGMFKVRSYRFPVEIPAGATVAFKIETSHPLAVNPAWYQFICADQYANFPGFQSLATNGCSLDFEFDPADEKLEKKPLTLEHKKTSSKELFTEHKREKIRFRGESVQWVRVDRSDRPE